MRERQQPSGRTQYTLFLRLHGHLEEEVTGAGVVAYVLMARWVKKNADRTEMTTEIDTQIKKLKDVVRSRPPGDVLTQAAQDAIAASEKLHLEMIRRDEVQDTLRKLITLTQNLLHQGHLTTAHARLGEAVIHHQELTNITQRVRQLAVLYGRQYKRAQEAQMRDLNAQKKAQENALKSKAEQNARHAAYMKTARNLLPNNKTRNTLNTHMKNITNHHHQRNVVQLVHTRSGNTKLSANAQGKK
jgi:hypothetical protein